MDIKCIASELKTYCSENTVGNFTDQYKRAVGVKCMPSIINENRKLVGQVIYLLRNDKFELGEYVEFQSKKIKWESKKPDSDGFEFYIVDPHFCKKYTVNPALDVEVEVYKPDEGIVNKELKRLTYAQFVKRRLLEYYGDWKHRVVAAIENYDKLRSKGDRYAINSTVKHYDINQKELRSFIGKRNKRLDMIRREWTEKKNSFYESNEMQRRLSTIVTHNKMKEEMDKKKTLYQIK